MLKTLLASSLLVVSASLASAQTAAPTTTPTLVALDRMEVPEAVHRATVSGPLPAATPLHLSISLAPTDTEGLEALVRDVSDPASPNYRRFLTPAEVGRRFGVSDARLDAIKAYLTGQGLKVTLTPGNRLSLLVEGTAAQAEKAFDVRLARYHAVARLDTDREDFYSYTETPRLPSAFASSIVHIGGLENATKPVPRMALTPAQTASLYKATALYGGGFRGEGRNLAISNFDGYRLSNVAPYYAKYALPTPAGGVGSNVRVVTVGTAAGPGTAQGEGDLDIQMVLGVAPLCNFTIYDSANDLIGVLTREVNDNTADVISESYGWRLPASTATAAHNLHLSMSAQGITYLAASGDNGTDFKGYDYPDFEPEVLQIGGTIATVDASGNRTSEVAWSGSGGGYSTNAATFNALPSWQKGTGVPTTINRRLVPDIALHASGGNSGAYPFYFNGNLTTGYVGTSFASPVMAGLLGLAEQKLDSRGYFGTGAKRFGRLQDLIYAQNGRSDVWTDATSGSNGTLPNGAASNAGVGWDSVTGWGAMNVDGFVNALSPVVAPRVYSPTSVAVYGAHGTSPTGTAASLKTVDDDVFAISSIPYNGFNDAMVGATFALPAGTQSALKVTIVAEAPSGAYQTLYLRNFRTNTADAVSAKQTFSGGKATFTFTVPYSSDYLTASGTVQVIERTMGYAGAFVLKTDQISVTLP